MSDYSMFDNVVSNTEAYSWLFDGVTRAFFQATAAWIYASPTCGKTHFARRALGKVVVDTDDVISAHTGKAAFRAALEADRSAAIDELAVWLGEEVDAAISLGYRPIVLTNVPDLTHIFGPFDLAVFRASQEEAHRLSVERTGAPFQVLPSQYAAMRDAFNATTAFSKRLLGQGEFLVDAMKGSRNLRARSCTPLGDPLGPRR